MRSWGKDCEGGKRARCKPCAIISHPLRVRPMRVPKAKIGRGHSGGDAEAGGSYPRRIDADFFGELTGGNGFRAARGAAERDGAFIFFVIVVRGVRLGRR